jgi:hypothetical protein
MEISLKEWTAGVKKEICPASGSTAGISRHKLLLD